MSNGDLVISNFITQLLFHVFNVHVTFSYCFSTIHAVLSPLVHKSVRSSIIQFCFPPVHFRLFRYRSSLTYFHIPKSPLGTVILMNLQPDKVIIICIELSDTVQKTWHELFQKTWKNVFHWIRWRQHFIELKINHMRFHHQHGYMHG